MGLLDDCPRAHYGGWVRPTASRSGVAAQPAISKTAVQIKTRSGKLLLLGHKGYFGDPGVLNGRHHFGNLCINDVLIGI